MRIHPEDEASLRRMLGIPEGSEVPAAVEQEYILRKRMFDRDGNSGAMRTAVLLDCVRYCGLSSPADEKQPDKIDWGRFPQDGSVRVEARFFGDWQGGFFLGFVQGGMLSIRLDSDSWVRECRPDVVRLASDQAPPRASLKPAVELAPAESDAERDDEDGTEIDEPTPLLREDITEDGTFSELPAAPVANKRAEALAKARAAKVAKAAAKIAKLEELDKLPKVPEQLPAKPDWAGMPAGTSVWVSVDGDTRDAKLIKPLDAERLIVQVDGEEQTREVRAEQVYEQVL